MRTGDACSPPARTDVLPRQDVSFANALPHLVWFARPDGSVAWYNQRWQAYAGLRASEVEGSGWERFLPPETATDVTKSWLALIGAGEEFEIELALRNSGESFCPFLTRVAPVADTAGKITHWIITHTPLSAQHPAKEALKLSEANLRGTFENAAVGIAHVAGDGNFIRVNQTLCDITGYPRAELLTKRFSDITHPDDIERDWHQAKRLAAGQISTYSMEKQYIRKDSTIVWIDLTVSAVRDEDGALRHFISVIEDINARKLAEERLRRSESTLRLALNAAYLMAFEWDIEKDEVRRHQNADQLMASTDQRPDTLQDFRNYVHPEDRAIFNANLAAALNNPEGTYRSEFRIVGLNRETRWFFERGRVEFDRDARPVRLVGLSQDITDRKVAEIKLVEAQRQLQAHAERLEASVAERTARLQDVITELDGFSHSIAHDLRAPLRSIRNFADILVEEHTADLPEAARACLARIVRASGKMDTMIHEVLEYSRISRVDLQLEAVDPAELLSSLIEAYPHFQSPQVDIVVTGSLPPVVASRSALTQCFVNLLGNAVKFMAKGVAPRIHVSAELKADTVRLWIEDNGIGIPAASIDKIWGMLERIHSGYEGAGVGLCIVRKAVERMRGTVGVESEVNRGSRFWLELPRASANAPAS